MLMLTRIEQEAVELVTQLRSPLSSVKQQSVSRVKYGAGGFAHT
jgi:hypothetical protein